MKSSPTFSDHFRTLGLSQESSWNEVRRGYRKLIKKWHPDQYHNESDELRLEAERKTQDLNIAYKALEAYYKETGTLPRENRDSPAPPPSSAYTTPDSTETSTRNEPQQTRYGAGRENGPGKQYDNPPGGKHRFTKFLIAGLAIYAAYNFFGSQDDSDNSVSRRPVNQGSPQATLLGEPTKKNLSPPEQFFYPGSTKSEVFSAQGKPDQENQDAWIYGKSIVYFEDGRVSKWIDDPNSPLRVKLARDHFKQSAPAVAAYLRKGMSKEEVREIQGNPIQETADVWYYGVSKIYFTQDKVSSWYESPMNPLKTRK